jgi:hypothetical protein
MEGSESLVQRLSKYTKGTWSGFINQPTNVDLNKKFVCFSVRDMEDDLKPVAMYLITHFIWNAVRKTLKKRLLVIDEAWWMMKSEDTASFLYGMAKRGRKYYLGLATITQDVDDFLKSPYGLPMITNSSLQLLLKQSPTTIDTCKKPLTSQTKKSISCLSRCGGGDLLCRPQTRGYQSYRLKAIPKTRSSPPTRRRCLRCAINRKAVVMACIGETLPGFSILPTWTAMVVGCIYMAYKQAAKSKLLGVATSVAGNLQLPDNSIGEAVEAGNQALLSQVLAQGTQARDFEEDASQENAAPLAMQDIRVSKQLNRDRIGAAAKTRPSYVKTT